MGAFFGALIGNGSGGSAGGGFAGAAIAADLPAGPSGDFDPGGTPPWPGTVNAPYGRLFLTLAGDATLGGLKAGLDGQQVALTVSGGNLTLLNLNGSVPADEFQIGVGDALVADGGTLNMTYTAGTLDKWVVSL